MLERRVRAYIGLGANIGDARATLGWAVKALAALPRVARASPTFAPRPM